MVDLGCGLGLIPAHWFREVRGDLGDQIFGDQPAEGEVGAANKHVDQAADLFVRDQVGKFLNGQFAAVRQQLFVLANFSKHPIRSGAITLEQDA